MKQTRTPNPDPTTMVLLGLGALLFLKGLKKPPPEESFELDEALVYVDADTGEEIPEEEVPVDQRVASTVNQGVKVALGQFTPTPALTGKNTGSGGLNLGNATSSGGMTFGQLSYSPDPSLQQTQEQDAAFGTLSNLSLQEQAQNWFDYQISRGKPEQPPIGEYGQALRADDPLYTEWKRIYDAWLASSGASVSPTQNGTSGKRRKSKLL